jgi:SAM-dependent methyltransferase
MKLHLGCGGTYLAGYINIDFPTSDSTIMPVKADIYQDIRTLEYPENSIDEIRSHHVFEHFERVEALKILLKWRKWLKPGGKLVIETPDMFWCSLLYVLAPFFFKQRLGRHLFGSQEASWAKHLDFWDKAKFKKVLTAFGFTDLQFSHPVYRHFLPNIKVTGIKSKVNLSEKETLKKILAWYIIPGEDNKKLLANWLRE